MPGQAERLQLLVEDAVAKGAKVLAGGKMRGAETGGQFFAPTVLEGITSEMRIWEEETFGPIISVVRWSDEDEMVDMVNDSPFGLGCNVFGPAPNPVPSAAHRLPLLPGAHLPLLQRGPRGQALGHGAARRLLRPPLQRQAEGGLTSTGPQPPRILSRRTHPPPTAPPPPVPP